MKPVIHGSPVAWSPRSKWTCVVTCPAGTKPGREASTSAAYACAVSRSPLLLGLHPEEAQDEWVAPVDVNASASNRGRTPSMSARKPKKMTDTATAKRASRSAGYCWR